MGRIYEPSLPKLMEAIATEARGMKGLDRRNFLKGGIAAVAGLASVQIIPKASIFEPPPKPSEMAEPSRTRRCFKPYGEPAEFEIFSAGLSPIDRRRCLIDLYDTVARS